MATNKLSHCGQDASVAKDAKSKSQTAVDNAGIHTPHRSLKFRGSS
jgi:hypothetical protein